MDIGMLSGDGSREEGPRGEPVRPVSWAGTPETNANPAKIAQSAHVDLCLIETSRLGALRHGTPGVGDIGSTRSLGFAELHELPDEYYRSDVWVPR